MVELYNMYTYILGLHVYILHITVETDFVSRHFNPYS